MSVSASETKLTFVLRRKFDSSAFVWHRRKGFSASTSSAEMVVMLGGSAQDGSGRGQVPPRTDADIVLQRLLEAE